MREVGQNANNNRQKSGMEQMKTYNVLTGSTTGYMS